MRIIFCLSLCFSLLVCCGPSRPAPAYAGRDSVTAAVAGTDTTFHIERTGRQLKLTVPRDSTVASGTAPSRLEVVGWPGAALIVVDTYPSEPTGMSFCQAGEERFLRVISLSGDQAKLSGTTKLESCRDSIELIMPLSYQSETRVLTASWLQPHPATKKSELIMRFDARGELLL